MKITRSRSLHITYCNKAATTQVKHQSYSWSLLANKLTAKPVITDNRETLAWPLFVPFKMTRQEDGARMTETAWGEHYHRGKANVEHMDLLVIDIDNDPKHADTRPYLSFDDAKQALAGLACIFYTSFNHKNPYKHNVDKFRVVLPLLEPVELADVEARKKALSELFPSADPASFTASQPFYVPIAHPDRAALHRCYQGEGEWFDLLALEATVKPAPVPPTVTFVQTDSLVKGELPTIKLKDGRTFTAVDLYNHLPEGYEGKQSCYRIGGIDPKPGCFIFRKGSGLMYYDPAVGKAKFIPVYKTYAEPLDDAPDAGTPTTLVLNKASSKATEPEAEPQAEPVEQTLIDKVRQRQKEATPLIEFEPDVIYMNERYLPSDLHIRIPKKGITVIRSPKGTGKTELLKKVTAQCSDDHESVMLLGHRVYLLQNLATRTNLDYYRDLDAGQTTSAMALCMNSLTRVDPKTDAPYDTLIIDESEQVFQALISPTLHSDLSIIFNNLIWLFRNAKRIICLDADLSADLTLELITEIRGNRDEDEVLGVINNFRIGEGRTTKVYEKRFHLLSDALEAIDAGEKVFIACNNRKFATAVDAIAKEMGKTSLLITAETNEQEDTTAFIENPTGESSKYDVVVASPTLSTGVSIEGHHFTKVFGFFGNNPGTYQDADQAISRVRHCDDVSVWVQGNKKTPMLKSEEDIYHDALETERGTRKALYTEDLQLTQGELLWARVYARISYLLKAWSINKDVQFNELRTELGFKLETVLWNDELNGSGALIYSSFKGTGIDRAQAVFDAKVLNPDEAIELGKKKQRTHDEQLAYERYRYSEALGQGFDLDTLRKAIKQELLRSIARLRMLHAVSDDVRISEDKKDRKKNRHTFTANKNRVLQNQLLKHLYDAAKINIDAILDRVAKHEDVEIGREVLSAIARAYDERKRDFNFYFAARIKDPTDEKNMKRVWDSTIGEVLSLPLVAKKRGPREARELRYFIDLSKVDLVHQVHSGMNQLKPQRLSPSP